MTSVLILLSGFDPGTYYVEDDGIPNNGIAQLRGPDGNIIYFNIPTEFLTVTASAGRSVIFNLTESFGAADINVGSLTDATQNPDSIQVDNIAGAGDVLLVSNTSITERFNDAAPDIVANTLILSAATAVGTAGTALETQVQTIEAETDTGGINLVNIGNVVIGGLTDAVNGLSVATSGDLTFVNYGGIDVNEATGFESVHGGNTSGNVTLVANGFDSDIRSLVDIDFAAAPGGSITLTAGRDIRLGTQGLNFDNDVRARNDLIINTGRDLNVDGFADLASDGYGAVTGGDVIVNAGRDINVLNSTGTDASIGAEGSGDGNVTLNTGPGGFVRLLATSESTVFASTGDVTVNTDRLSISSVAGITADNGTVTLAPRTAGWAVNLGSATDAAFALEISDAELDRIFTSKLTVGNSNTGPVSITAALTPANFSSLDLVTGTDITGGANVTLTTALTLLAADNIYLTPATINVPTFAAYADLFGTDPAVGGTININALVASTTSLLVGNQEADIIVGTSANETIYGNGGNDTLRGFGGADMLDGGAGADTMVGGLGDDVFYVDSASDVASEAAAEGNDRVAASVTYALQAGSSIETLETITLSATTAINLSGNELNQTIIGNAGNNLLVGGGGNDTLNGSSGDDTIVGNSSASTMIGGTGNDTFFVNDTSDAVIESSGGGNDRVAASVSYTLLASTEVETLEAATLSSVNAMNLTGNVFIQSIVGNNGANVIDGKGGNDTLNGAGGADTFAFTTALGAGNVDTVIGFVSGTDKIGLDDAIFPAIMPGALAAGAFFVGAAAGDADDRIIYNSTTGALFYDPDGTGGAAQVQFATLSGHPALAGSDFLLI